MRTTTRSLALAGAAGVLTAPTAIALAADGDAAPTQGHPLRAKIADAPTARAQMRDDRHDRLVRRHRRLAEAAGARVGDHARLWSNRRLDTDIRRLRKTLGAQRTSSTGGGPATPQLAAIAACESGGNPSAVGGGGAFRGKYQFTYESWQAVGGSGDPADAPEAEQDRRAAMLMERGGADNWPVCAS